MNFDIAIIGGGPAGYTAAERAGANGLKAVLFEKKAMGGVCLNEGCIPTKTLLYSAKILDSIKSASKYGVSAESSFVRFIQDYEPQRQNSENVDGWREDDCEFLRSDDRGERSFYRRRERGDDPASPVMEKPIL